MVLIAALAVGGCIGAVVDGGRLGEARYRVGEEATYSYTYRGGVHEVRIAVVEASAGRIRVNVTLLDPDGGSSESETAFVDLGSREVVQIGELRGTGVGRIQYAHPGPSWPGYPLATDVSIDQEFAVVEGYRPIYSGILCLSPKIREVDEDISCSGGTFGATGRGPAVIEAGDTSWEITARASSVFPQSVKVSKDGIVHAELRLVSHHNGGSRVDWTDAVATSQVANYTAPATHPWDGGHPLAHDVDPGFSYHQALTAIENSLEGKEFRNEHPESRVTSAYHKREPVRELATGRPIGTTVIRWWITLSDQSTGESLEMLAKREMSDHTGLTVADTTQVWEQTDRHVPAKETLPTTSVQLSELRAAAARLLDRPLAELGTRWTVSNHPARDGTPEGCTVSVQHEGSLATVARFSCTGRLLDWGRL